MTIREKPVRERIVRERPVRERIVACAVKLLGRHGLKRLAQPQIAKAAEVPQGHITYYFPTRSDLLMAVADRTIQMAAQVVLKQLSKSKGQTGSLIPVVSSLLKDNVRTRTMLGLAVESDENPELRKKLQDNLEFSLSLTATSLGKEAVDEEVVLIHSALVGLAIHDFMQDPNQEPRKIDGSLNLLTQLISGVQK